MLHKEKDPPDPDSGLRVIKKDGLGTSKILVMHTERMLSASDSRSGRPAAILHFPTLILARLPSSPRYGAPAHAHARIVGRY
jgi:hypothetical protein